MPARDPTKPQLDFPQLIADLIAQLQLQGPIGLLDFNASVQPTVLVAIRDGVGFTSNPPNFTSGGQFSSIDAAPLVNTVLADTGQLPAGIYDVKAGWSVSGQDNEVLLDFQHRNAANAANLAEWGYEVQVGLIQQAHGDLTFAYELGVNERFRWQTLRDQGPLVSNFFTWIMVQIRPAP